MTRPSRPESPRYRWWRDGMLLLIAGITLATVGLNLVMVWYAEADPPDLVRPDYYAASKVFDKVQEARIASARLGWQVAALAEHRTHSVLEFRIEDAGGKPASGLTGHVHAYRPSDNKLDQQLQWNAVAGQPGLYRASFHRPAEGLWRITLDVRQDGKRLYQDVNVVMP